MPRRGDSLETRWTRWPHTKAKHDLLVRYLGAWFPIMGRSVRKAIVLDAFAGPGRYDHGEEGSPILVLNALLEHKDFANWSNCEFVLLFKLYLPLNWGITAALAIITFISAWNNFFWPFLVVTSEDMMTIPVGITQVTDAFGVAYARMMALALLAAAPVIIGYLIFQRRVTEAGMISAGGKG